MSRQIVCAQPSHVLSSDMFLQAGGGPYPTNFFNGRSCLKIPDNTWNLSLHLFLCNGSTRSPNKLVPLSNGNTATAFQRHRNQAAGSCPSCITRNTEMSRGGTVGRVKAEKRDILKVLSTVTGTGKDCERVVFVTESVVKAVADDDVIVFRL